MKIIADTHTHTVASTHAFSTLLENVRYAKEAGLCALAITDHAPNIQDAPHIWHFYNLHVIPRQIDGVYILRGAEANFGENGSIDLEEEVLQKLDWVVASFHTPLPGTPGIEDYTQAYSRLAENPYVDVIGHSGTQKYLYDYRRVIPLFKKYGKIVEINEGSAFSRPTSRPNCLEIAKLCKEYQVPVVVNSDAHFAMQIGHYERSLEMLESIGFPEELVLNADKSRFLEHIRRTKRIDLQ